MKRVLYFICEHCGEEFDSEEECLACEQSHRLDQYADSLKMFSKAGDELPLDFNSFESADFITCKSQEAAMKVKTVCDSLGISSPFDHYEYGDVLPLGTFAFEFPHRFPEHDNWLKLEDFFDEVQAIVKKINFKPEL